MASGRAWIAALLLIAGCEEEARSRADAGARFDASAPVAHLDAGEVDAWLDSVVPREAGLAEPTLAWSRSEVPLEPDGRTAPLTFSLAGRTRPVFTLRAYTPDSDVLCFQLEDVRADGAWWVPGATSVDFGDYCTSCSQRVAVGHGYGMFVLPSAAQPESVGTLQVRVALRDCLTLSPLSPAQARPRSLIVESASSSAPSRGAPLTLPLVIAVATPEAFAGGASLDDTFVRVRSIWRLAGIELVLRATVTVPRPSAPVEVGASDRRALSDLASSVEALAGNVGVGPRVVLTPCLRRRDEAAQGVSQPLALTTHVPGGFSVANDPDAIFVAAERCGGLTLAARYGDSETLAAVIAHELGHYLGLFHVEEADGRVDALDDTHANDPNLMLALPHAGSTALTETQTQIARRHPALMHHIEVEQQLGKQ